MRMSQGATNVDAFAQHPHGDRLVFGESSIDQPQANVFAEPYFFFANRHPTEVTFVSPSVEKVLGYDATALPGLSYDQFLIQDDPLNEDVAECQQKDLSDGTSIHALRSVRNAEGGRRILYVRTVGACETPGGPVMRRHNVARDVTHSVQAHTQLMSRLQTLDHATRQLSRQERTVADKILEGKMNRDIARELNVSDRTIERRRATIMRQLNAATTAELVSKLVEHNLLVAMEGCCENLHWQDARNSHLAVASLV